MGKYSKLKGRILSGTADSNIEFRELCQLLIRLVFEERVRGDHHIFVKENITVRSILTKYMLGDADVDEIRSDYLLEQRR